MSIQGWGHVELWIENRNSQIHRTHRDLLGVRRSYSTWCLSGMRGRMASNRGSRFGSLMTSFRSPTSTGRSMDLGEQKGHIYTRRRLEPCSFEANMPPASVATLWFAPHSSLYQISFPSQWCWLLGNHVQWKTKGAQKSNYCSAAPAMVLNLTIGPPLWIIHQSQFSSVWRVNMKKGFCR